MHGILFKELKAYVTGRWGEEAWEASMARAGIEPKLYLPVTEYPDAEALALVDAVVAETDVAEGALLEAVGEHLAPALLDTFRAHVKSGWSTLDLLERAGAAVLSVLRSAEGGDGEVTATREDADTVVVEYASPLEMCALARGLLAGIADVRGESVAVVETSCMHAGADRCEFRVTRG